MNGFVKKGSAKEDVSMISLADLQRRSRIAEMSDERVEGTRSDIVGPDQPQPVDPVGL